MSNKKRSPSKRTSAAENAVVRAAVASGKNAADEVIAFRAKQRRKRAIVERKQAPRLRRALAGPPPIPAKTRALFRPRPSAGLLIAEGDSWFDYPLHDVLELLEDDHLFDVESVAHRGDCVEDMAHSPGQFEEFARRLEKLLREGKVPRAILLSGGGNDIAGDEFAILLNHAASSLPVLNEDVVHGIIDVRLRAAYARIISGLTTISESFLNRPIQIITHGYDYPVPDGRGFLGGFWLLPGPWLKPGFQKKGYDNLEKNKEVLVQLIDRFNDMIETLIAMPGFSHVLHLDLRNTLKHDTTYRQSWANELHPSPRGFELVTDKFAKLIDTL